MAPARATQINTKKKKKQKQQRTFNTFQIINVNIFPCPKLGGLRMVDF